MSQSQLKQLKHMHMILARQYFVCRAEGGITIERNRKIPQSLTIL